MSLTTYRYTFHSVDALLSADEVQFSGAAVLCCVWVVRCGGYVLTSSIIYALSYVHKNTNNRYQLLSIPLFWWIRFSFAFTSVIHTISEARYFTSSPFLVLLRNMVLTVYLIWWQRIENDGDDLICVICDLYNVTKSPISQWRIAQYVQLHSIRFCSAWQQTYTYVATPIRCRSIDDLRQCVWLPSSEISGIIQHIWHA